MSRFSSFLVRACTTEKPTPHRPLPMRFMPSSPGIRKSVARPRLGDPFVSHGGRVGPAAGPLQRRVRLEARQAALRPRRIVPIDERLAGHDEQRDAAGPQRDPCLARIEHGGPQPPAPPPPPPDGAAPPGAPPPGPP